MSQKKVDAYKKDKANRSKIVKREKRMRFIETGIAVIVVIGVAIWMVFSIGGKIKESTTTEEVAQNTDLNIDSITDYLTNLNAEEAVVEEDAESLSEEASEAASNLAEQAASYERTEEEETEHASEVQDGEELLNNLASSIAESTSNK